MTSGKRIGYAGYQFDPATEQYHVRHRVRDPAGSARAIFEYIEMFYNRKRPHAALGYLGPEAFEAAKSP